EVGLRNLRFGAAGQGPQQQRQQREEGERTNDHRACGGEHSGPPEMIGIEICPGLPEAMELFQAGFVEGAGSPHIHGPTENRPSIDYGCASIVTSSNALMF